MTALFGRLFSKDNRPFSFWRTIQIHIFGAAFSSLLASSLLTCQNAHADNAELDDVASRLRSAYPAAVRDASGGTITMTDGTKLPLDDGVTEKTIADWLEKPDIQDMFRFAYPAGAKADAPPKDFDPGRARNEAFFLKMYGDCREGNVESKFADVIWLPKKSGQKLRVTKINGVAEKMQAVSNELDTLPKSFDKFLIPSAGTYNCRPIAGTKSLSAHGYGIAIDIATETSHYWRWAKGGPDGPIQYANSIPAEIVAIFEKHGFIWGGRWYHYDTMHFEYRPELLPPLKAP